MSENDPQGKMDELYWGTLEDLHMAEESLFLEETISQYALSINDKNFGNLFGKLQIMLLNNSLLYIRRLFEEQKGYPLKSIPAILDYMARNKDCLKITDRSYLEEQLDQIDDDPEAKENLKTKKTEDSEITNRCASLFKSKLGNLDKNGPIENLKDVADKKIAHNEDVQAMDLREFTDEDKNRLLEFSKTFLTVIARAFLNSTPIYDNNRCGRGLKRLLIEADVIENDWPTSS